MNQQPPVHQFRIRPFKLFWGWTKNTSSSLAQGFFSPLLCPKIFPSYLLLPPLLPPSPHFPLTPSPKFSRTWVAQSFEKTWDIRLEEGGELNVERMWRGESKRSASSQMQKRKKKGKLFPFTAFFFFSMVFSLCFFFFFLCLRIRRCQGESTWNKRAEIGGQKWEPKVRG